MSCEAVGPVHAVFTFELFEIQTCKISLGEQVKSLDTVTGCIKLNQYFLTRDNKCLISAAILLDITQQETYSDG